MTTNKSIDTIALEVEFSNKQHLLREFERWFRSTPSRFRRNYKTNRNLDTKTEPLDMNRAVQTLRGYLR